MPTNATNNPLDQLPDELAGRLEQIVATQTLQAAAAYDLDERGMYVQGCLLLTGDKFGHFVLADGQWQGRWLDVNFTEAVIIEALGLNLLRIKTDDSVVAEFRFTLRYAKSAGRFQRTLERRITGDAEDPAHNEPSSLDEKKLRCEKCNRVIPAWSEVCQACMSRRKILFRLLDFVWPHKTRMIAAFVIAVILTAMSMAQPWLTRPLVNRGFGAAAGIDPDFRLVVLLVAIMGVLAMLRMIGQIIQLRLSLTLGTIVSRKIRNAVYAHLHRLSLSFFAKRQTGALVTRVTNDTERLWYFVSSMFIDIILAFLTITAVGVCLFIMSWKLAIFSLMPFPIMLVLMKLPE